MYKASPNKEWRHQVICRVIHWRICIDYGLDHADKWYEHRPEAVVENEEIKLLWDMRIQTDKTLTHDKPDILLMDKIKRKVQIIDIACPFDTRVLEKENEKITNYQNLKLGLERIWNCQEIEVIPIVKVAPGTISKKHIFFEFFTSLTFACNFNLSAGNLGLFEKSSIYFIRRNSDAKKTRHLAH